MFVWLEAHFYNGFASPPSKSDTGVPADKASEGDESRKSLETRADSQAASEVQDDTENSAVL
ncbi:hypothetical protein CCR75_004791 [Bremia lactucae]|uniref:Uncharacterized protein n=1 Tax=Bremia lactucae TaxID=4779 RepID=A0A976FGS4_BRELC|nr:hypothetical protein CCR75_004791 [Bremia lactucae]